MKQTLLEIVSEILSSMDSDEVNSIDDTVEAQSVAKVVRRTYYDIVGLANLPTHTDLFELEASGTSVKPVLMTLPTDLIRLDWVKYNVRSATDDHAKFQDIRPLPVYDFVTMFSSLDTNLATVGTFDHTVGGDSITFSFRNDTPPTFYTSYDDSTVIFDAFDSGVDSTLQKTKTMCFGLFEATWSMVDSFTPDLDHRQFSLLVNESKAQAFQELKQASNTKAEQRARRAWIKTQGSQKVTLQSELDKVPNYGRK